MNIDSADLSRAVWRKPSRSVSNGACVEIARGLGWSAVRDSKDTQGPALVFTPAAWQGFIHGVKRGDLNA